MKKMLMAGMMTLALLAAVQQQAQAWSKFNFGVGLNVNYVGGGNSALWGLVRGSPMPGTECPDGGFNGDFDDGSKRGFFGRRRNGSCPDAFSGIDAGFEIPADAPRHAPPSPDKQEKEKIPMPMPSTVKPANFNYEAPQTQQPSSEQTADQQQDESPYAYPSYYFAR